MCTAPVMPAWILRPQPLYSGWRPMPCCWTYVGLVDGRIRRDLNELEITEVKLIKMITWKALGSRES